MTEQDVYRRLAEHLNRLGMGYPVTDDLIDILKENFSEVEAEIALAIPSGVIPLQPVSVDVIFENADLSRDELSETLRNLSRKGLVFSGETEDGQEGYALQQVGFGFPQSFFWKGEDTPHAKDGKDVEQVLQPEGSPGGVCFRHEALPVYPGGQVAQAGVAGRLLGSHDGVGYRRSDAHRPGALSVSSCLSACGTLLRPSHGSLYEV